MSKHQKNNLTVEVRSPQNSPILEFDVPYNTNMKNIHKILQNNKNEFETPKLKLIGFETLPQDPLQDYCLHNKIGSLKTNLTLKPLYRQPKNQGLAKYKMLKCLATGGFSKVYLVRSLDNGQFLAAKFIDKLKVGTDDKKVLIENEKNVNEMTDYQFLVKMHEFIETQNFFIIVMDYCPGGQLFYLLRKVKRMNEQEAKVYFIEILLGLDYLHKKGIMYRDLKPQNIMLDMRGHAKIADFGLAKFSRQKSYSYCGSIEYMSPQIVANTGHSFEVDFYCLGALLYELLIGCPPFYDPELSQYETKKNIVYAQVQFPQQIQLSLQVKDLIQKLLVKNPNQRLGHFGGAKQIMLHPWVGKINRQFIESKNFQAPFPPNLCQFNFDPDEIGLSEERFTNKISCQYKMIKEKRAPRLSKAQKDEKQKKLCFKSKSPYAKKYSLNMKKPSKQSKKQSQSSLLNVTTGHQSQSNFRKINFQDPNRLSTNKKLTKNKSPSFVSFKKKQFSLPKKTLKNQMFGSNKFLRLTTQSGQWYKAQNQSKLKKKKIVTESDEIFRQASNDFTQSKKCFIKKSPNQRLTDAAQKHFPEKNILKKSSKLKIKKLFNQTGQKSLQYGKLFRDTCIV